MKQLQVEVSEQKSVASAAQQAARQTLAELDSVRSALTDAQRERDEARTQAQPPPQAGERRSLDGGEEPPQASAAEGEVAELKARLTKAKKQFGALRKQLAEAQEARDAALAQVAAHTADAAAAPSQSAVDDLPAQVQDLQTRLDTQQAQATSDLAELTEQHSTEAEELRAQCAELQGQVQALGAAAASLEQRVQDASVAQEAAVSAAHDADVRAASATDELIAVREQLTARTALLSQRADALAAERQALLDRQAELQEALSASQRVAEAREGEAVQHLQSVGSAPSTPTTRDAGQVRSSSSINAFRHSIGLRQILRVAHLQLWQ